MLGSGAGGGFPQWNCNCVNCKEFRSGTLRAQARTQSSVALSADSSRWYLLNASPDIRQQINASSCLSPRSVPRDTPIQAILLTNGEIDHVAGLLSLRESQSLCVYSTAQVRQWVLETNAVFRGLFRAPTASLWKIVRPGERQEIIGSDGKTSGLWFEAFLVPGKPPAYLTGLVAESAEATIAYKIIDAMSQRSLVYLHITQQRQGYHASQLITYSACQRRPRSRQKRARKARCTASPNSSSAGSGCT